MTDPWKELREAATAAERYSASPRFHVDDAAAILALLAERDRLAGQRDEADDRAINATRDWLKMKDRAELAEAALDAQRGVDQRQGAQDDD